MPFNPDSVEAANIEIRALLAAASREAAASGKKLLVVAGEQHLKREGLLTTPQI